MSSDELPDDATHAPTALDPDSGSGPPRRIGPYRVLEEIGEGGMGVVYVAEQSRPIRRRVALKVIKVGMDTKEVVARFESERQALALMDHPNIAKVLDAGATDEGRPYFVMEYVKGVPINTYCDERRLDTRRRLKLFMQVCDAIQHAHQKGIIHRDIKASNVLVGDADGRAAPKVIDFGVAKATSQRLTERTLYTQQGIIIGTPEYMSPEQAAVSPLGVDTRTDIYSLGVLLYELMVGVLPFDPRRLRDAALHEMVRIIREEDALRLSKRLLSLGDTGLAIAKRRRTDVNHLRRGLAPRYLGACDDAAYRRRKRKHMGATDCHRDEGRCRRARPGDDLRGPCLDTETNRMGSRAGT